MQQTMLLLVLLATSVFAQDAPVGPADLISQADFLLQMNCGGSTGVSTYSVTTNDIAGNMTNPALANVWLNLANTYQWAQPSMSMDYLCANMQEFAADRDGAKLMGSPLQLIFVGDSTMQCMRFQSDQCTGAVDIYKGWWGEQYTSSVWAIGGDTTSNMMWRLLNGNQPEPSAKVIVLYVGIMDVQQADQDPDMFPGQMDTIANQITSVAEVLKQQTTDAQILLLGLLPITGYDSKGKPSMTMSTQVHNGLKSINSKLSSYGAAEPRVSYIDCMDAFLTKSGGSTINKDLYADTNVPTRDGFVKLAGCINKFIDQYMAA